MSIISSGSLFEKVYIYLCSWYLILGLLFAIQDYDSTVGASTGQPVAQIFLDTVGEKGAIVLMVIVIGCMFMCGKSIYVHNKLSGSSELISILRVCHMRD